MGPAEPATGARTPSPTCSGDRGLRVWVWEGRWAHRAGEAAQDGGEPAGLDLDLEQPEGPGSVMSGNPGSRMPQGTRWGIHSWAVTSVCPLCWVVVGVRPSPRCPSPLPGARPSPGRPSFSRAPIPSPRHLSPLPSPLPGVRPSPGRPSPLPGARPLSRPLSWASVPSPIPLLGICPLSHSLSQAPVCLPSVRPLSRASVPSPRHPSISRVPVSSPRWSWASVPPPGGHGHPSPLLLTGAPTPGSPWPVSGHPPLALIVTLGLGTPCHPQCRCTWSSKGKCHWARCWGQSTLATNAWLPSPADHASGWIMPGGCLFARAGQGWGALEGPGPLGTACAPPGPGCLQALINSPGFAGRVHGCG